MKLVIAVVFVGVGGETIDTDLDGDVIDGEFTLPFESWAVAADVMASLRDRCRAVVAGEEKPAIVEMVGEVG